MFYFVNVFLMSGKLPWSIKTTWVTLNPIINKPTSLDDYIPIYMVGALYKIEKLLSTRLKFVMPSLIDESEPDFVMNRQILDGTLVASELVNWMEKKNKVGTLLKLDF